MKIRISLAAFTMFFFLASKLAAQDSRMDTLHKYKTASLKSLNTIAGKIINLKDLVIWYQCC
ncbi:MAG TPA: hypothetical protein VFR70_10570 [Flavobacterium sp.]|nr:hypothetical protein [Flavobacterium sp.]